MSLTVHPPPGSTNAFISLSKDLQPSNTVVTTLPPMSESMSCLASFPTSTLGSLGMIHDQVDSSDEYLPTAPPLVFQQELGTDTSKSDIVMETSTANQLDSLYSPALRSYSPSLGSVPNLTPLSNPTFLSLPPPPPIPSHLLSIPTTSNMDCFNMMIYCIFRVSFVKHSVHLKFFDFLCSVIWFIFKLDFSPNFLRQLPY